VTPPTHWCVIGLAARLLALRTAELPTCMLKLNDDLLRIQIESNVLDIPGIIEPKQKTVV